MQIYPGAEALSDFRKAKLLQTLQSIDPAVSDLQARYIHFVDTNGALSTEEEKHLQALLTYGNSSRGSNKGSLILVVPRPGTISSWSSKATDIAHNSGLQAVARIERGIAYYLQPAGVASEKLASALYDRMTESVLGTLEAAENLFVTTQPKPLLEIDLLKRGKAALLQANESLALALSAEEIDFLFAAYKDLNRNPTDAELMMFGVVNSEHCRHKIFNAVWHINGRPQPKSLFKMIKNTYEKGGQGVLSAYSDNAAVLEGEPAGRFFIDPKNKTYRNVTEPVHSVIKVETHNHPTAIAPVPGAATGVGGEIRDEAATGRGAKSKMGLTGFSVSNLEIPGARRPWEKPYGKPDRLSSALNIMLEGPIGGAGYANEFGRPNVTGYFRTFQQASNDTVWGYHKPIMIAGGLGNIRDMHVHKKKLPVGAPIIVLGGPAMLIGLAGGTSASMETGASSEDLDFTSVQRANAELERRCQEVIDSCWARGEENPILSIHDVGAGGLSNALPELVHDSGRGATFELRDMPSAEPALSPMEIWSNESQERYVLGINPGDLEKFREICQRERCPFAVVGHTTAEEQLVVTDRLFKNTPVNIPLGVLFGSAPKMTRQFKPSVPRLSRLKLDAVNLEDAVERVLKLPAVGSKKFLITIGDRNVGGLITRDQMVGPWQVPVSDVAVAASAFDSDAGEAMAMGERSPLALINAPASGRMAIGEAITNMAAADIAQISDIKLSANWMAAAGYGSEDENLFKTVSAVGEDFCPALGITIPVGKDSLSMRTTWQEKDLHKSVTSPLSLIISGFAPVASVKRTLTPQLDLSQESRLLLVDLSDGHSRLGGSALAQVYNQLGDEVPDADPDIIKNFFSLLRKLKKQGIILAYHDRSDGGLFAAAAEMAFAGRCGLELQLAELCDKTSPLAALFNEELGVILQIRNNDYEAVRAHFGENVYDIGRPARAQQIVIKNGAKEVYAAPRAVLESWWSDTSYRLQKLRDDPECADQEFSLISNDADSGLQARVTFPLMAKSYKKRPKVAILREQGVNGHIEMAAAFHKAGFTSVDVHLNDLMKGEVQLDEFVGLAACGGFSYGDVLGAGEGWAKSILFDARLRTHFKHFFERFDTFSLGVCNGCQMLSALKELIPGAHHWPAFVKNKSEQFEARLVTVRLNDTPSVLLQGMAGSCLPVPVAHGEGRAKFANEQQLQRIITDRLVAAQYVDNRQEVTSCYPLNPNGSPEGVACLTTPDGRATIMMPHPERAYMTRQLSWHPPEWDEDSPWFQLFLNARTWAAAHKR